MLHIKTFYSGLAAALAKELGITERMKVALRQGYEGALDFWHKKIRPGHFEVSALAKYGYTPRTVKYERSKGHRRPLVYSGDSERATERNYIKFAARSASLHMDAGNLLWNPGGGRINMRDELLRTTSEDETAMARIFERDFTQSMRDQPQTHTENIG